MRKAYQSDLCDAEWSCLEPYLPVSKPTSTRGIYIFRITDGKLAEAWDAWDELGLLEQIGAVWRVEREEEAGSA